MTDNEIAKTLECCISSNFEECWKCPLHNDFYPNLCHYERDKNALNLIKRQKAEFEELNGLVNKRFDDFASEYDNKMKSEAIKEFAEKLKACLHTDDFGTPDERWRPESEYANIIDDLVKEMTEVKDNA